MSSVRCEPVWALRRAQMSVWRAVGRKGREVVQPLPIGYRPAIFRTLPQVIIIAGDHQISRAGVFFRAARQDRRKPGKNIPLEDTGRPARLPILWSPFTSERRSKAQVWPRSLPQIASGILLSLSAPQWRAAPSPGSKQLVTVGALSHGPLTIIAPFHDVEHQEGSRPSRGVVCDFRECCAAAWWSVGVSSAQRRCLRYTNDTAVRLWSGRSPTSASSDHLTSARYPYG